MEEAHDYRFASMLEPEPESLPPNVAESTPVQEDIVESARSETTVKTPLRQQYRERRAALSDKERTAATRRIVERLLQHPDVHRAKTVLLYAHYDTEIATDDLAKELLKRGKIVAYPKMTAVAGLMTLWRVKSLDALIPHKQGIRAPDVTRSSPIEPLSLDCVIYPGLAFTKGLVRLGQGGGYYDRLSSKLTEHCACIGICFEVQIATELPRNEFDMPVHWVVTEATVYPYVPDPPAVTAIVSVATTAENSNGAIDGAGSTAETASTAIVVDAPIDPASPPANTNQEEGAL